MEYVKATLLDDQADPSWAKWHAKKQDVLATAAKRPIGPLLPLAAASQSLSRHLCHGTTTVAARLECPTVGADDGRCGDHHHCDRDVADP